jgi:protein-S-isoprenylcysteine O-methyltransferase Ste14
MKRAPAVLGSIVFFVIAPGTLAGLAPYWISRWRVQDAFFGAAETRWAGVALCVAGLAILIDSFARFALQGFGTPAPLAPPTRLVVTGLYRHVRNPMYVGVIATILGQALILADIRLLTYCAVVWLGFHLFVLAYEEPTLERLFGEQFRTFRANVPRWIPRLWPWVAQM